MDDIWDIRSILVYQAIIDAKEIIESWIQVCDTLTRLFWPNYARHVWLGSPHTAKNANQYLERLNEIQNIRDTHKEIVCIFNEINQMDKSTRQIFIPFHNVKLFDVSMMGVQKWKDASLKYQAILEPINEKIAVILKAKLAKSVDKPIEVTLLLMKFSIHLSVPVRSSFKRCSDTTRF